MDPAQPLDRRQFLKLASLVAAGAGLSACSPLYRRISGVPGELGRRTRLSQSQFRLLGRLAYGPSPQEARSLGQAGAGGWVEAQLAPHALDDSAVEWRLRGLDALNAEANVLAEREKGEVIGQLQSGSVLRKVYSTRQLHERMVEFWSDHFNISVHKGDCWFLKVVDDREVIRAHAMGSFRDLLWASAHSPAMLVYLDNQANLLQAPNENYARELLELHTLGVDAGYTQRDVMELARCFTGWSVKEHFWRGEYRFEADHHDWGTKQVLGSRIEPAGQVEAENILEHLALHPATAKRLATKLMVRFVGDRESPAAGALIEHAADRFLSSSGSIRTMLQTIIEGGLLGQESLWRPKFKRPLDFVTSSLRALNADTDAGGSVQSYLRRMGHGSFEWPMPDGPTEETSFWWTNLLPRWQFAMDIVTGGLPGTEIDLDRLIGAWDQVDSAPGMDAASGPRAEGTLDLLAEVLLGTRLQASQRDHLLLALTGAAAPKGESMRQGMAAGLLASPGFQWH